MARQTGEARWVQPLQVQADQFEQPPPGGNPGPRLVTQLKPIGPFEGEILFQPMSLPMVEIADDALGGLRRPLVRLVRFIESDGRELLH